MGRRSRSGGGTTPHTRVKLSEEERARVEQLAAWQGVDRSEAIRRAIDEAYARESGLRGAG